MCGICGITGPGASGFAHNISTMLEVMGHRGPDGSGRFQSGSGWCTFGHRRLAVIDPSPSSAQPAVSLDQRCALAYNGELYNFRELRAELRSKGATFHTDGDTEVVFQALSLWGADALHRFNGMFALAFWQEDGRKLLLARDRFGQKPLFVSRQGESLVFASEVRALLAAGFVDRRLDRDAVRGYLSYGSVPGPRTIVHGVSSLEAGSLLEWSPDQGERRRVFWEPQLQQSHLSPEDLRKLLRNAVARHLVSDVPLGVFLSGGLDSACIAALASEAARGPVRTFTLGFPDQPDQHEAAEAQETAQHLKTRHSTVALSAVAIRESLDAALKSQDQPSGDGFNTWLVARAARDAGLTVALSGLGSDELFGGYDTFRVVPRMFRIREVAGALSRFVGGTADLVAHASPRRAGRVADLFQAPPGLIPAYLARRRVLSSRQVRRLAPGIDEPGWMPAVDAGRLDRLEKRIEGRAPEDAVALLELSLYMGDTLLRDADTMGMAHSLEIRMPFLDTELSDAVLAMGTTTRQAFPAPKHALLRAVGGLLPASLPGRRKKGFTLPLSDWMRGELRPAIADGIEQLGSVGAPFDRNEIHALWLDFLDRPARVGWYRPWMLFVLGRFLALHGIRP